MTIALNNSIVTDGLAFYYDEKNRYRGYLGKPITNLLSVPNNFDNATWTKSAVNVTQLDNTRSFIDPWAYGETGDRAIFYIDETTASAQHYVSQSIALTSGVTYVLSVYARASEIGSVWLATQGEGVSIFNLNNGTVSQTGGNVCQIRSVGNGWYRCSAAILSTATSTRLVYVGVRNASTYTGVAGQGIYVARAQLEVGELTQFVNGSRTTTTTCYDLISAAALTANNVTLAESGITFPGTIGTNCAVNSSFSTFGNNFTLEAWGYNDQFGVGYRILAGRVEPHIAIAYGTNEAALLFVSNIDGKSAALTTDFFLDNDLQYHHVAGVSSYDTTSNRTTLTLYLDGEPVKSQIYVGAFTNIWSAYGLAVGSYYTGSTEPNGFIGKVPNAKVYNRALTRDEVKQNYLAHKGLY